MRCSAFALILVLGTVLGAGCADPDSQSAGVNAPCTRDRDCRAKLACMRGVCVDPNAPDAGDAGDAAGARDAAGDD